MARVWIGKSSGDFMPMEIEDISDMTLSKLLEQAGLELKEGNDLMVNGRSASLDDLVNDGDRIQVTGDIEWG